MLSRVTSLASFSSLQPSVPAGRIGSTMKRVSAVESQTRIVGAGRQRHAEIGEYAARVVDRARAIGRRFVPDRRQAEHLPRVAGAQRADDHVVLLRRVLYRDEVIADAVDQAERDDRLAGIGEQRRLNAGSLHALATTRAPLCGPTLVSIGLDDDVDRGRVDIALLGQHGFQRAHAQLHLGKLRAMLVVIVIVMVVVLMVLHHAASPGRHRFAPARKAHYNTADRARETRVTRAISRGTHGGSGYLRSSRQGRSGHRCVERARRAFRRSFGRERRCGRAGGAAGRSPRCAQGAY